jgi:hypothetical protein
MRKVLMFMSAMGLCIAANAAEVRMLDTMPTGTKVTPIDFKKSEKGAWLCQQVKVGPKGNWNVKSGGASAFFASVPDTDSIDESKSIGVKCTLKVYDKEKRKAVNGDA